MDLEELTGADIALAGGKGAGLGELLRVGVPVPPGFCVTAAAYRSFIERSGIQERLRAILSKVNYDDPNSIEEASRAVRGLIDSQPVPRDIEAEVKEAYRRLGEKIRLVDPAVAVRSSATAEDLADASFAGQQESYLGVRGEQGVMEAVKRCWGSLFTPRAIYYRYEKGFEGLSVNIAVIVQKLVNSRSSGVIFTLHPATGEEDKIVIEGGWGLGETIVSGVVTPDQYIVDKETMRILDKKIAVKSVEAAKDGRGGVTLREVPEGRKAAPALSDEEIYVLADYAKKIEAHFKRPMDIEWAIDNDLPFPRNVFILQARPETVWSTRMKEKEKRGSKEREEEQVVRIVAKGLPASPGIATGVARLIMSLSEAGKMNNGDILVTKMTAPDWVPYMRKAAAIVTTEGGITCHAAIVSRELGIPCIVGTGNATEVMRDGEVYTVDANSGVIYAGMPGEVVAKPKPKAEILPPAYTVPITGTKIYMNLGVPEKIEDYKNLPFDGIGLMRIEFIMTSYIGEHPLYLLEKGRGQEFIDKLADGISIVAKTVYPRPVVVRLSDLKTNEYKQLKGGEKYEPPEENPMMGWRGVSRYISKEYEAAFRLELRAIKKCRDEYGLKNVWVMLPFVRTIWELEKCLAIMESEGLRRSRDFKIWLMAEVPSIIFLADEFAKLCDGFSIGSNDLTQLVLGVDRDSAVLPHIDPRYFDERDPAVLRAIKKLVETAHANGATVSICGQAPSVYPEFTEFLVRSGIDSVSVNADVVVQTRSLVASVEQRIILERSIKGRDSP